MSQKEIVTKENLLICSVRWGDYNPESKNGFFPFEGQWIDSGLNYKVFHYERNLEIENIFTNNYGPMGEYIYYKIVLLSRSLTQFVLREKFEPKYIVFCDYSDTLLISSADDFISKLNNFKGKTILGSEKNQFPLKITIDNWNMGIDLGSGHYLNSGVIFSEFKNFLKILNDSKRLIKSKKINYASDQGVWQILYNIGEHEIELDIKNEYFFNLISTQINEDYTIQDGKLITSNGNSPCIIHQNGPWPAGTGLIELFGESKKLNSYFDSKMINKFTRLRNEGFKPKTVLDIGAWRGTWARSFTHIFPYADILLFEANPISEPYLKESNYRYFNKLLWKYSNVEKDFYTLTEDLSNINTGSSLYIENTPVYNEITTVIKKIKTETLDNLLKENNITDINFIKIDVQGSELDIFDGAENMFKDNFIEFILMELSIKEYNKGTPDFYQCLNYMEKKGFYPFDIFEIHEWEDRVFQIDVLFVNKHSNFYKLLK